MSHSNNNTGTGANMLPVVAATLAANLKAMQGLIDNHAGEDMALIEALGYLVDQATSQAAEVAALSDDLITARTVIQLDSSIMQKAVDVEGNEYFYFDKTGGAK